MAPLFVLFCMGSLRKDFKMSLKFERGFIAKWQSWGGGGFFYNLTQPIGFRIYVIKMRTRRCGVLGSTRLNMNRVIT